MNSAALIADAERDALRFEIRLGWDDEDPWGSVLSALGGICDVLHATDHADRIPASAGYRPSVFGPDLQDYPASMFAALLTAEHISVDALAYWARVLDRFADLVPEDRRY